MVPDDLQRRQPKQRYPAKWRTPKMTQSTIIAASDTMNAMNATNAATIYPRRCEQSASKNAMPAMPAAMGCRMSACVAPCSVDAWPPLNGLMPNAEISFATARCQVKHKNDDRAHVPMRYPICAAVQLFPPRPSSTQNPNVPKRIDAPAASVKLQPDSSRTHAPLLAEALRKSIWLKVGADMLATMSSAIAEKIKNVPICSENIVSSGWVGDTKAEPTGVGDVLD
ncbi:unnamed protein product [Mycena citricolor]|uniref:Uncharacterized protein n=1 Tax=Mycena citricolor TaxID=2018698 RepID=A0AAD2H7Q6_9AGAR|nr:unnamed protein product [Mycena citricolor]